ncbi:hypothetical protein [Ferroplasma sp.]|jgi:hypothetical protein|uniref:hypothetical protein n=1 Tax=Ferroplasma sp. TaxID=2591003 RepID=UPI0026166982|nr:hypothetical protein [Ferroplasma sp.]
MSSVNETILRKSCKGVYAVTEVYLHSKKFDLLKHMFMLVDFAIDHRVLTDIFIESGMNRSQLSRPVTGSPHQVFVEHSTI